MKLLVICVAIAAFCLAGCNKPKDAAADRELEAGAHGRYSGIGTYSAGRMWKQMVEANDAKSAASSKAPATAKDPAASNLADDEQVVVVVDTKTGEIRQCGNLTGYCIGMNPWAAALSAAQAVPVRLAKHADDIDAEAAAEQKKLMQASRSH